MRWYSLKDISEAYSLTMDALKHRVRTGKLKAEKLQMGRSSTGHFKYIIPESELPSLEQYKLREPTASPNAQPGYYGKRRREREEEHERFLEAVRKQQEERRARLSYYDYLRSEEWQRKRRARLKLDGYRCQMCGSGTNLQVHHISYDSLRTDAEIDDLVTLCRACHEQVHAVDLARKQSIPVLYLTAVKALREGSREAAWQKFSETRARCTPPLTEAECSQIWQSALKAVYPL